ncbi:SpaA isopeptide-forming pilin-related protein, partial [Nocardioides kongjuensis]
YSDWANGVAVAPGDAGYQTYWLAEVKAPTGYELLAQPVEFTITAESSKPGVDLRITNLPNQVSPGCAEAVRSSGTPTSDCNDNGGGHSPFLPQTGGPAFLALVAGLVLVAGGALFVTAARRRGDAPSSLR